MYTENRFKKKKKKNSLKTVTWTTPPSPYQQLLFLIIINSLSFLFLKTDVESDFRTKSILCMPIFNTNQKIVGEFVTVQTYTLLL